MKEYQAQYFQSYKGTEKYYRRLEKRREYQQKIRQERPPKVKPLPEPQPEPIPILQLYRPPTPEPEPPQPTSFSVTFS